MLDYTRWMRSPTPHLPGLWRLRTVAELHPDYLAAPWRLQRDGPHSLLFRIGDYPGTLVKLIRPRSTPRDPLRKYFQSQALREYKGAGYLRGLGLVAPKAHAWGVVVSPFSEFESVLIMEELTDFVSGLRVIRRETDKRLRACFLEMFAAGIAKIHGCGYIHTDCHFENVGRLADGRLAWIDTDVRRTAGLKKQRKGLKKTLRLLRDTARSDIETQEWRAFVQNLKDALTSFPNGSELRHEIQ